MRRALRVVWLASFWLAAPSAAQEPLPLELTWHAPDACPTASDVHGELARIARARAGRTLRPLAATVDVRQTTGGFQAAVRTELEGQAGERELRASDCATLARSVTLVLALAFGPDIEIEHDAPSPPPSTSDAPEPDAPEPSQPPEPSATSEPEPEPEEEAPSTLRVGALLSGGVELTLLPEPAPLLTAGLLLELSPALSLQLRASALPAVSEPIATSATARYDGLAGTALGCGRLAGIVELCGGARVAALRARARGLFRDDAAVAPWYGVLAAASVGWPSRGPLRIALEAALTMSLYRPRFAVHELGRVHRAPLLAPELSVQLQLWP